MFNVLWTKINYFASYQLKLLVANVLLVFSDKGVNIWSFLAIIFLTSTKFCKYQLKHNLRKFTFAVFMLKKISAFSFDLHLYFKDFEVHRQCKCRFIFRYEILQF